MLGQELFWLDVSGHNVLQEEAHVIGFIRRWQTSKPPAPNPNEVYAEV